MCLMTIVSMLWVICESLIPVFLSAFFAMISKSGIPSYYVQVSMKEYALTNFPSALASNEYSMISVH